MQQRLGTLELKHAPDEEIELFDWCGLTASAAAEAKTAVASAAAKNLELQKAVHHERLQARELLEAKHADEAAMLEKFRDLLNEKKLKIREQLRIIAASTVVPNVLAGSQQSDGAPKPEAGEGHVAQRSRPTKRKVAAEEEVEDEDDESDGFEKMDVDSTARGPARETSDDQRDTTDAETEAGAETETASEGEDEDEGVGEKPAPPSQKATPSRQSASQQPKAQESKSASQEDETPPPRRDLPFMKKKPEKQKKQKEAPPPAGSETESDDEL